VDYVRPVEALVPGVHGRVLGVLARTETEMTIRTVARLAGVSAQQASVVVAELVSLGVVGRREAGSSALVRLERDNEAAALVIALSCLRERVMGRLRDMARVMTPVPASLIVFGSFARGETSSTGDLDVLAVRPDSVPADDAGWVDALGAWDRAARQIVGNPVHMLVVPAKEVGGLLRRRSGPWRAIANEGVVLVGGPLSALAAVA
jgi:hypothetical protein